MEERRGLVVRRDSGEGCVVVSVSSTSNDRFNAVRNTYQWLGIKIKVLRMPTSFSMSKFHTFPTLNWLSLD